MEQAVVILTGRITQAEAAEKAATILNNLNILYIVGCLI